MAAPLISAPPRETPFLAKDGRVSTPWISWLYSITAAGVVVQTLQTLQIIAEDNSTDANTASILAELTDTLLLLAEPRRPDAVSDEPIDSPQRQAQITAELEDLRSMIAAADPFPGAQVKNLIASDSPVTSVFSRTGAVVAQSADYASFYDAAGAASTVQAASLQKSANLSDVGSVATAKSNLGLGVLSLVTATATGPDGVATTVYTFPGGLTAAYSIHAHLGLVVNDAPSYAAIATVVTDGTSAKIMSVVQGLHVTISLSGLNLLVAQSSGASQPLSVSILRIG